MTFDLLEQSLRARILVVDDVEANVMLLQGLLRQQGYRNVEATSDSRVVAALHRAEPFDLILLDLHMPHVDGFGVMEELRAQLRSPSEDFLPVIVVTAFSDQDNRLKALRAGARDYITKPFIGEEVAQRIRNYLEVRMLYRERRRQSDMLRRFFSPQLAERILAGGVDDPLRPHRREITAVFIDLRGFTAFTERAEPEEVMEVLREYHAAMGRLIVQHEGTIEFFAGDGILVMLNDPVEVADHVERALRMALGMQAAFAPLAAGWRRRGFELSVGFGVAKGYATIGAIGFEGRWDYGAIGSVTNLAARLCAEARAGQVLVARRALAGVEARVRAVPVGELALKGFSQPVEVVEVVELTQPELQEPA
jgi:class 3 adenylate cyclase